MGQYRRISKRRHAAAKRSMSKEADQLTSLIANLRKSVRYMQSAGEHTRSVSDPALGSRRKNLAGTIELLEDRLAAIQGLIKLDRPHIGPRIH
jgi:hypothetical protein